MVKIHFSFRKKYKIFSIIGGGSGPYMEFSIIFFNPSQMVFFKFRFPSPKAEPQPSLFLISCWHFDVLYHTSNGNLNIIDSFHHCPEKKKYIFWWKISFDWRKKQYSCWKKIKSFSFFCHLSFFTPKK